MTAWLTPEERAELTELQRRTDSTLAQIMRGLDEGLSHEEIAARCDVRVGTVQSYLDDWKQILARRVPGSPITAEFLNTEIGYVWDRPMSSGLHDKLYDFRLELRGVNPELDPDHVTTPAPHGMEDRRRAEDYGPLCPHCGLEHRGECPW